MKKRNVSIRIPALLFLFGMILTDRSGFCILTLFAAALHECGHFLAASAMHIPLKSMSFDLLGARLEVRGRMLSYGEEWLLAAAGPLASLLISLIPAPLWNIFPPALTFSEISAVLGLLNLLPIRTFDGGRMLETTLMHYTTPVFCRTAMNIISFSFLFLLWAIAVYCLLRVGDGLSLFCFSMSLFTRFFERETDI